jgi:hypothetical protein
LVRLEANMAAPVDDVVFRNCLRFICLLLRVRQAASLSDAGNLYIRIDNRERELHS